LRMKKVAPGHVSEERATEDQPVTNERARAAWRNSNGATMTAERVSAGHGELDC